MEYFSYLSDFNIDTVPSNAILKIIVMIIALSIMTYSLFKLLKIEDISFTNHIIFSFLFIFFIITIFDYNNGFNKNKFIFSSYKSKSDSKTDSYYQEFQALNEKSLVSSSLNEKKNLLNEYINLKLKLAHLIVKLQKSENSQYYEDIFSLWSTVSHKKLELEKEIKGLELKNTPSQKPNHSNENYEIVDDTLDYNPNMNISNSNQGYSEENNESSNYEDIQSNSKSSYDSNENTTNSSYNYDETLKVISGGIDLIRQLSKNPNWEERYIPLTCTRCGKVYKARGYYKETTNEFKPTVDLPTEWFHTHNWVIMN